MDINRYIGLFLLKHDYVFLPSIGSFYLVKKAASYIDENNELVPPSYAVEFKQGGGSIDDSFASFIATNERISIAHAANNLKSYCAETKKILLNEGSVTIEGLGVLQGKNGGQVIEFVAEKGLEIKGKSIPFFKRQVANDGAQSFQELLESNSIKEPKAYEDIVYKAPQVNWGKIATLIGILLVLVGGGFAVYYVINKNSNPETDLPASIQDSFVENTTPVVEETQPETTNDTSDSSTIAANQNSSNEIAVDGVKDIKLVINQYSDSLKAVARLAKLRSYGHQNVAYTQLDNGMYGVYLTIQYPISDTSKLKDSLRIYFNPNGKVEILP